jgi:hypothetical protein
MLAGEMPHKFKIGAVVNYRPKDRVISAPRGTYVVIGLNPRLEGQQPEYRIRHFSEEFERVAMENELSPSEAEHGQR